MDLNLLQLVRHNYNFFSIIKVKYYIIYKLYKVISKVRIEKIKYFICWPLNYASVYLLLFYYEQI